MYIKPGKHIPTRAAQEQAGRRPRPQSVPLLPLLYVLRKKDIKYQLAHYIIKKSAKSGRLEACCSHLLFAGLARRCKAGAAVLALVELRCRFCLLALGAGPLHLNECTKVSDLVLD